MGARRHAELILDDVEEEVGRIVPRDRFPDWLRLLLDLGQHHDYLIGIHIIEAYANIADLLQCLEADNLFKLAANEVLELLERLLIAILDHLHPLIEDIPHDRILILYLVEILHIDEFIVAASVHGFPRENGHMVSETIQLFGVFLAGRVQPIRHIAKLLPQKLHLSRIRPRLLLILVPLGILILQLHDC